MTMGRSRGFPRTATPFPSISATSPEVSAPTLPPHSDIAQVVHHVRMSACPKYAAPHGRPHRVRTSPGPSTDGRWRASEMRRDGGQSTRPAQRSGHRRGTRCGGVTPAEADTDDLLDPGRVLARDDTRRGPACCWSTRPASSSRTQPSAGAPPRGADTRTAHGRSGHLAGLPDHAA